MSQVLYKTDNKIQWAVDRLNNILPLKKNQMALSPSIKVLYKNILLSYVDLGRSLNKEEITAQVDDVDDAIKILKENDLVVFNDVLEPIGAYPFTMDSRIHKLKVNDQQVHCMCALDSLAVSPMFDMVVEISSQCHVSNKPVHIKQNGLSFLNAKELEDVYFGISWSSASSSCCCADSLCTEMIFLKGDDLAKNWQASDSDNREIFNLDEAVAFSARFFVPLMA